MSLPATLVNPQITDAVTQSSVAVIGQAPAFAMGSLFQAASQSMASMLQNGATGQGAMNQVNVAVVSTSVARILSMAPSGGSSSSSSGS